MPRRLDWTLLALLFCGGLLFRLFFLVATGFDGLYGQDAYAYYDFAGSLQTLLSTGQPLPPFFWPLGYSALLASGFALFGASAAVGQAMSVIMSAGLAPLVYIMARQMQSGIGGAFVAGLLMAVCGQAIQSSLVLMADIPALFWALLSGVLLLSHLSRQPLHRNKTLHLIGAVICLMLAVITRWLYLGLIPVWGAALLLNRGTRRREWLSAGVAGILVLLPQLALSVTSPYPTFSHAWVQGWSPGNAFQHEFTNVDGHFSYEQVNALFYAQPVYDAYYLSPLFTPLIVIGLWAEFRRRRFVAVVLLGGWILLPYLFLAGIPYQNIRFPLIISPPVALLAGIGLENAVHWLSERVPHRILAYSGAVLLVIAGAGQMVSTSAPIISTFITNQQADKTVITRVAARLPAEATVYTFGLTLALSHYTDFQVYELYYETPDTLAQKWQPGQTDYLLVDPWNINSQWAGREPQTAMQWFENQRGLTQIGQYSHYVLYRIGE